MIRNILLQCKAIIERKFLKDNCIYLLREREEILRNCRNSLGETGYSVLNDNCQTFVSKKRNGVSRSPDIETIQSFLTGFAVLSVTAITALWLNKRKNRNSEK